MQDTIATRALPSLGQLSSEDWRGRYDAVMTPQYGKRRLALVRGEGTRVWDAEGREYLDFLTGISVNNLGHCHPRITAAIREQAATICHTTNIYYIPRQIQLAELLVQNSFSDCAFFCNSGAEANEAAIKITRRHASLKHGSGHPQIISMRGSFHGRTIATLSAAGPGNNTDGFEPLVEGFPQAAFNDLGQVRELINENTAGIIIEPVQGEGGIHIADHDFIVGLRRLCDQHQLVLIFDEVQCGLGRVGALFAYETYDVEPDVMTLAKSLGGGMAMGSMLCRGDIAEAFGPGTHGTTLGGNHITSAAALAYVSELIEGDWATKADQQGRNLEDRMIARFSGMESLREIRRRGLMIAVELKEKAKDVLLECELNGLLVNVTGGENIRLLPPLNVSNEEISRAVEILDQALRKVFNPA
jgi:acetylornithine/N-succinyldiaminopimelate aminotransferase